MATSKREEAEEADRKFQNDLDKVEIAFRNLDKDGDGFIDWEEFREVKQDHSIFLFTLSIVYF